MISIMTIIFPSPSVWFSCGPVWGNFWGNGPDPKKPWQLPNTQQVKGCKNYCEAVFLILRQTAIGGNPKIPTPLVAEGSPPRWSKINCDREKKLPCSSQGAGRRRRPRPGARRRKRTWRFGTERWHLGTESCWGTFGEDSRGYVRLQARRAGLSTSPSLSLFANKWKSRKRPLNILQQKSPLLWRMKTKTETDLEENYMPATKINDNTPPYSTRV